MSIESLGIIVAGLVLGSLVKGISGIGLPLVAIPVMAGFMPVDRAVAIMVLPNLIMNMWLMWSLRAHAVRLANLPLIAAVGVLGVVFGSWLLSALPEIYLVGFMTLWLGGYLLHLMAGREFAMPEALSRHAPALVVALGGVVQGAAGTAGPIIAPYVHSLKLRQPQFVFVVSVLFQIFALTQLVSFLWLGLIDGERLLESLAACVPIAICLPLAVRLGRRIGDRAFNGFVIALLVVIEARLIWRMVV